MMGIPRKVLWGKKEEGRRPFFQTPLGTSIIALLAAIIVVILQFASWAMQDRIGRQKTFQELLFRSRIDAFEKLMYYNVQAEQIVMNLQRSYKSTRTAKSQEELDKANDVVFRYGDIYQDIRSHQSSSLGILRVFFGASLDVSNMIIESANIIHNVLLRLPNEALTDEFINQELNKVRIIDRAVRVKLTKRIWEDLDPESFRKTQFASWDAVDKSISQQTAAQN